MEEEAKKGNWRPKTQGCSIRKEQRRREIKISKAAPIQILNTLIQSLLTHYVVFQVIRLLCE